MENLDPEGWRDTEERNESTCDECNHVHHIVYLVPDSNGEWICKWCWEENQEDDPENG